MIYNRRVLNEIKDIFVLVGERATSLKYQLRRAVAELWKNGLSEDTLQMELVSVCSPTSFSSLYLSLYRIHLILARLRCIYPSSSAHLWSPLNLNFSLEMLSTLKGPPIVKHRRFCVN